MALNAATVWEVRTTGSDSNGGGFQAGATGTDYSQQNSPQITYTDLVIDGTTNTKATSAAFPFDSTSPGNIVNITGGTGFTVQRAQVVSVAGNVATFDKSLGTLGSTGGAGKLGGALASLTKLATEMASSNKAFIKSGTYTETTTVTFSTAASNADHSTPANHLVGYYATRGDLYPGSMNNANKPLIQIDTTGVQGLVFSNQGWRIENLSVAPTSGKTLTNGIRTAGAHSSVVNCKVSTFNANGISQGGSYNGTHYCEVTGGTGGSAIDAFTSPNVVEGCWIHDNSGISTGISFNIDGRASFNVLSNNGGVGIAGWICSILYNTVHASGSHGINISEVTFGASLVRGNLLTSNGGYGLRMAAGAGTPAAFIHDGNAYWNNTSGTRNQLDDTAGVNGVGAYANPLDVVLVGTTPYTNAAANDFTLNNTAGAGASLRGAASLGVAGLSQSSYRDFGAFQHADSGGGLYDPFQSPLIRGVA